MNATSGIEAPIGRDRLDRTRHSLDTPTPREAVTWFEVRELLPLLEPALPRSVELRLELVDGLPPVKADPSQIQQIIIAKQALRGAT